MAALNHLFPSQLPAGFTYLQNEPAFEPAKHLQLEQPERVLMLAELGYAAPDVEKFASPVAAVGPVRVLSDEGVAASLIVVDALIAAERERLGGDEPGVIFNASCRSRFFRDLSLSEEVSAFFGGCFETTLMPHSMLHLQSQLNLARSAASEESGWHHDIAAFAYILMLHDPAELDGGRFEYFYGRREEAAGLLRDTGALPEDRLVRPDYPGPGFACFMQGSAITHRGGPMWSPGFRAALVTSDCSTELDVYDANRVLLTDDYPQDPQYARYKAMDWARHNAWRSREKLDRVLNEMPYSDDPQAIAAALEQAVVDAQAAAEMLKRGLVSSEEANRLCQESDRKMLI
jgi:hypothetical protein